MMSTLPKLKKLRKEPLQKSKVYRKRSANPIQNLPFLCRLLQLVLVNLGTALVLSLLVLIIFVPKGGVPAISTDHLTCAIDAGEEATGPIIAPSGTKQFPQFPDLNCMEQYEFEQGVDVSNLVQGKLRLNSSFWRDVLQASAFVLDIIEHGYKIIFLESPLPYSFDNRSSALQHGTIRI